MIDFIVPITILVSLLLILLGLLSMSSPNIKLKISGGTQYQYVKPRKPSFFANIIPFTPKLLRKLNMESALHKRLSSAYTTLSPQEFFNMKIFIVLICSLAAVLLMGELNIAVVLGVGLASYLIPDFFIGRMIAKRKYLIARGLPETVDLLGLCVEAGLDFVTAVRWLLEKTPMTPLLEELAFVLEEIKWGKPRINALKDMSKRLNVSEITSFVQTLVQAERMGTPVSEAFMILSEDTRLQRFHRGERQAMQAPIKILIPLIFCILPVIGIVIGGPIFLQFMQGGLF